MPVEPETSKKAREILRANTLHFHLNGKTWSRIIPSKEFYVHQWNWDSATHAMGLVHIDEKLAYEEIRSLLSGQWKNGLVAQITFNPNEKKYFPGPAFWGTESFATGEIITSGITQPPLLAIAVAYVYQQAKNRHQAKDFLLEVLPKVEKYHEYLKTYRDPEDEGLLTIIHPWESGTDNSPRFDSVLEAISLDEIPEEVKELVRKYRTDDREGNASERPRLHDYYRYMYLVSLFKSWEWDYQKIVVESPFAIKDMLFSSIWSRANKSLGNLFTELGDTTKAHKYLSWAEQTNQAIQKSWDPEKKQFTEHNVAGGEKTPILEDTISTLLPLYAGAVTEDLLPELLRKIKDSHEYGAAVPVPSTALDNPYFDPKRYWRGSTWPITNLFLIDGLSLYEKNAAARQLRDELLEKTRKMIQKGGFFEYFHPKTGEGVGFGSFSWTAAIYLYLSNKYMLQ